MSKYNELVRNGAISSLKIQGYECRGRVVEGEEYLEKLYSLFLQRFKDVEVCKNANQLEALYADMLEIIKAIMAYYKVSTKQLNVTVNQPLQWYVRFVPHKVLTARAKTNLLERLEELSKVKSKEVVVDQLNDVFRAFKDYVEVNNQNFLDVEKRRVEMSKKEGGYSKGIYLESIRKIKTHTI